MELDMVLMWFGTQPHKRQKTKQENLANFHQDNVQFLRMLFLAEPTEHALFFQNHSYLHQSVKITTVATILKVDAPLLEASRNQHFCIPPPSVGGWI